MPSDPATYEEVVARAIFNEIGELDGEDIVGSFMPGTERRTVASRLASIATAVPNPEIESLTAQLAEAILAEREACAKVAESERLILSPSRSTGSFGGTRAHHGKLIATAIRTRSENGLATPNSTEGPGRGQ